MISKISSRNKYMCMFMFIYSPNLFLIVLISKSKHYYSLKTLIPCNITKWAESRGRHPQSCPGNSHREPALLVCLCSTISANLNLNVVVTTILSLLSKEREPISPVHIRNSICIH